MIYGNQVMKVLIYSLFPLNSLGGGELYTINIVHSLSDKSAYD